MRVRQIDTTRPADVRQFVTFPFKLYRPCPQWVPPLVSGVQLALDRQRHPFYQHSTADFFVAESEGQTLGRIATIHNRNYNAHKGTPTASFYFFEVVEDTSVAHALLDAAIGWARGRGLTEMIGPKGLLGSDSAGVLVEGFEHRPAISIAYNPPYYDTFLTGFGFSKDTDFLSGYARGDHEVPQRYFDVAEAVKQRRGFWIKTFANQREMSRWAPRVALAHTQAFAHNREYVPLTGPEMEMVIGQLLAVARPPQLIKLVMQAGQIVGFIFAYADVSAGLQRANGRLWPLGWYHIWREYHRTRWVNVNGLGLLPTHRGLGVNAILYTELAKSIREFRYEHVDLVHVEESNFKSRAEMEAVGARWYKRHRNYRLRIP